MEGVGERMTMTLNELQAKVALAESAINGEFSSTGRVVDELLDLRLVATGRPLVINRIDRAIREVPGRTLVPNNWWRAQLHSISQMLPAEDNAHGASIPNDICSPSNP